jgi:hypothetical protein
MCDAAPHTNLCCSFCGRTEHQLQTGVVCASIMHVCVRQRHVWCAPVCRCAKKRRSKSCRLLCCARLLPWNEVANTPQPASLHQPTAPNTPPTSRPLLLLRQPCNKRGSPVATTIPTWRHRHPMQQPVCDRHGANTQCVMQSVVCVCPAVAAPAAQPRPHFQQLPQDHVWPSALSAARAQITDESTFVCVE